VRHLGVLPRVAQRLPWVGWCDDSTAGLSRRRCGRSWWLDEAGGSHRPIRRHDWRLATPDCGRAELAAGAAPRRAVVVVSAGVPARRRRAVPADDPLSAERTRWLVDAVGGGTVLAGILGVSPSQPSRWASGDERPGIQVAPALIDLEHVLARVGLVWAEPAASTWMVSANTHLGGARPADVLVLRGPGPVLEALDAETWGGAA
jgi:hypothetical protein